MVEVSSASRFPFVSMNAGKRVSVSFVLVKLLGTYICASKSAHLSVETRMEHRRGPLRFRVSLCPSYVACEDSHRDHPVGPSQLAGQS